MLKLTGLTSTKTGVAPTYRMEFAVAINERLGHNTSSPSPMLAPIKARCRAVVHDETATACLAPTKAAKRFSNSATRGPWLSHPLRNDSTTASSSSRPTYGRAIGIIPLTVVVTLIFRSSIPRTPLARLSRQRPVHSLLCWLATRQQGAAVLLRVQSLLQTQSCSWRSASRPAAAALHSLCVQDHIPALE